jgi:hypothetical protein
MFTRQRLELVALALTAAACSPDADPAGPSPIGRISTAPPPTASAPEAERSRHERLAAGLARAMRDPDFRRTVYQGLAESPFREHKLHLQGFLDADRGRERIRLGQLAHQPDASIRADLDQSAAIEIYLPVPEHRLRWLGDDRIIVATAETDRDAPVAFDLMGRRFALDPRRPPTTPVLMVNRAEQRFESSQAATCIGICGGGSGGGGSGATAGLYLTQTSFTDTFEGWFKGDPEFEVHVLGRDGTSNVMATYQCAGEHAGGSYTFDQNTKTWSGSVLLFTGTQFANYNAQHAGDNVRIFVLEDDDTACQIKVDSTRASKLFNQLKLTYGAFSGGRDSSGSVLKYFIKARFLYDLFRAAASFITTNDDIVGTAVADSVAASGFFPAANWVVKGENGTTTGALRLEMR